MNALSKAIIADNLCEALKLPKASAKEMVEIFFEQLRNALESGQHVNYQVLAILS